MKYRSLLGVVWALEKSPLAIYMSYVARGILVSGADEAPTKLSLVCFEFSRSTHAILQRRRENAETRAFFF